MTLTHLLYLQWLAIVVFAVMLVWWIIRYERMRARIYDDAGRCRECRFIPGTRGYHGELGHHANCPIGRLGL